MFLESALSMLIALTALIIGAITVSGFASMRYLFPSASSGSAPGESEKG